MSLVRKLQGAETQYKPVLTYQGSISSAGTSTSLTYTAAPIGAAATDRLVVVVVGQKPVSPPTLNSVTVGGVSATKQIGIGDGNLTVVSIWTAIVPTGTTANVVAQFSGSRDGSSITVYTIHGGASPTAKRTAAKENLVGVSTSVSVNMDISQKDAVILGAASNYASAANSTITGATENVEYRDLNGANGVNIAASILLQTPQTARTFTATFPDAQRNDIVVAAFNR